MPAATIGSITRGRVAWQAWRGPAPTVRRFIGTPTGRAARSTPDGQPDSQPDSQPDGRPDGRPDGGPLPPDSRGTDPGLAATGAPGGWEALPPFAGPGSTADATDLPATPPPQAPNQPADPAAAHLAAIPGRPRGQRLSGLPEDGSGAGHPGERLFEEEPGEGQASLPVSGSFESPARSPAGPECDEAAARSAGPAGVHPAPQPTLTPHRIIWESGRACLAAWNRWRRQTARPPAAARAALPLANPSRIR